MKQTKNVEELVSLAERQYLAKHCTREMGKEIKMQVLDIEKATEYMRSQRLKTGMAPYVVIKPIVEDKFKEMRLAGTYQKDPKTGIYYGVPVREDNFGNIIWRKIRIVETETLRIHDSLDDAKMWTVLRFHPKVKNSPWQDSNPVFEVFDPVRNAGHEISKATSMKKAFEAADELSAKPDLMLNFVRFMGEEVTDYTQLKIIEGMLSSLAMQDPITFLRKFNDPSRNYYHIFHAAYQSGLLEEIPGQGFYFKNTPLGMDEVDVVAALRNDQNLIASLVGEIEQHDEAYLSLLNESGKKE